jgi:hypothetical protein
MVGDFRPLVQVAAHLYHVVEHVICLFEQSGGVAVLIACVVGGESVFAHAQW